MKRNSLSKLAPLALTLLAATAGLAFGQEAAKPPEINSGDTAWMLASSALVMLMTPALAFFYGGLVRAKNALNTMMMSFIALGVVGVLWAVIGYSLAFSITGEKDPPLLAQLIGGFNYLFLNNVGQADVYPTAPTIPHLAFMVFQAMFAVITPALISGAIVERMKFKTYLVFITLWSLFIYSPLAHMVWSPDGLFFKLGALDFAGGTVVHISAGVSALVASLILGSRRGFGKTAFAPHNVPFVLLGAGMLWFGWFGFNAGSAVSSGGLAASAFVTTNLGAAAAMVAWALFEILKTGKATAVGAATGAVVGLVAITPAAGFVSPMAAIAIGVIGAGVSFTAIQLKHNFNLDDSLDVFFCHGLGGITGALLTGVFAQKAINSLGSGLIDGNAGQLWIQFQAVFAAAALAAIGTAVLLYILKPIMGLRPSTQEEEAGLDLTDHGESGYHGGEYGTTGGLAPIGTSVTMPSIIVKSAAGD
jgi:ammonium transporter, Amt family